MAKETGLGWTAFTVDNSAGAAKAIVNDIRSLEVATPRAVFDVTGMDKSAFERLLGLADCTMTPTGVFNDETDFSHSVFSTVSSTSVARTTTVTVSGQSLAPEMLYTDYSLARSDAGELTWTAPGVLANGVVPSWTA